MIVYQLHCSSGHEFEAWFRDSVTYDAQAKSGDVACPHCGDSSVSKSIMAPNISPSRSKVAAPKGESESKAEAEARAQAVAEKILEAVGEIRKHIEENCDDVGTDFAEEARRIHYGETEQRGIVGTATNEEAGELDEEGIEFFRLPSIRRND